ncbi:MAG TPA: hypothetical protein VL971_10145, partial [Rhizomicrobium sp.]|nr:hypothetical protein [Rhizomicrobium sp.]
MSTARVRCRQIAEADLDNVTDLLTRGFPRTTRDTWTNGFARFRLLPTIEGVPRFGYALESDGVIVGVILMIASQRGDKIFSNLSSWYVEPAFRSHSTMLISMATKLKHVTYVNISPAPHTRVLMDAQNFRQYVFGRSAVFAMFGFRGGRVSDVIPHDLPERDLLRDHAAMGCISLVCEQNGVAKPFVFQPRRLNRPPFRAADLYFSRSEDDFRACAPALARWLLRSGLFAIIVDGKVTGMPA